MALKVLGPILVGASVGLRPQAVHREANRSFDAALDTLHRATHEAASEDWDDENVAFPVVEKRYMAQASHRRGLPESFVQEGQAPVFAQNMCAGKHVRMAEWFGRFGNNLKQIVNAVVLAKWAHIPQVGLPRVPVESDQPQPMKDLLDIPKAEYDIDVSVEKGENWFRRTFACSCDEKDDDIRFHFDSACAAKDPENQAAALNAARRKVMMELFWSRVHNDYSSCAGPDETTLTIHGRYGDVAPGMWNDGHPQGHLYPCSFYDHLIDTHNFKRVIFLIQEKDVQKHPCGKWLPQRDDIEFEFVTSLPGAVCNVAKASNLVVPLSTFSQGLVYANQRVKRVFAAKDHTHYGIQPTPADKCQQGSPEFYEYDIEGFTEKHTEQNKIMYMISKGLTFSVATKGCLF